MKRVSSSAAILIAATLFVAVAVPAFSQVLDVPVARVELYKVDIVTQRELRQEMDLLSKQLRQDIPASQRKKYLEAKIGEILVTQAAEHDKVLVSQDEINSAISQKQSQTEQAVGSQLSDAQFHQIIENQGMTWTDYQSQIKKQLLEDKYIRKVEASYFQNLPEPTPAEIQQTYDENATSFTNPAMVRFNYIAVDTRNLDSKQKDQARTKIDGLYKQIRTGQATFDDLLRKSVDDPSYTGGDFGYLVRNDPRTANILGQSFIDAVFGLKNNEMSGVLESNVAYYIAKVTDKRSPKLLTLDDPILPGSKTTVRDRIRQYLMTQSQQKAFTEAANDLIAKLKKKADIQVYEDKLNW